MREAGGGEFRASCHIRKDCVGTSAASPLQSSRTSSGASSCASRLFQYSTTFSFRVRVGVHVRVRVRVRVRVKVRVRVRDGVRVGVRVRVRVGAVVSDPTHLLVVSAEPDYQPDGKRLQLDHCP